MSCGSFSRPLVGYVSPLSFLFHTQRLPLDWFQVTLRHRIEFEDWFFTHFFLSPSYNGRRSTNPYPSISFVSWILTTNHIPNANHQSLLFSNRNFLQQANFLPSSSQLLCLLRSLPSSPAWLPPPRSRKSPTLTSHYGIPPCSVGTPRMAINKNLSTRCITCRTINGGCTDIRASHRRVGCSWNS